MPEPALVAIPPKGGSFSDVVKRLTTIGWIRPELAAALRQLNKLDKQRVKLEEGLIALWESSGYEHDATMRAADRFGHDLDDIDQALKRMRRWRDAQGRERLDYTPRAGVDALLAACRADADLAMSEAASAFHLQLDLGRPGKPVRMMFNHLDFSWTAPDGRGARGVLLGTEHEVTPTYLRTHKRDLSLTCYDAFHNTLLDLLDTGKVHHWRELTAHLSAARSPVRILGSLGLDDYLGHCVLMSRQRAERVRALNAPRRWAESAADAKLALLTEREVLIDPAYEQIYRSVLDADQHGIRFAAGPKDIERTCAEDDRVAIYIVRSGSTVAITPNLCVVGEELITSETIVAANQERMGACRSVGVLVDGLAPATADHAPAWRTKLAAKLGDRLVF
jgi:hypothetical protein